MSNTEVTLQDVFKARQRISSVAVKTPLIFSPTLSERVGGSVYLKTENVQQTGSFKIRGAANKLLSLTNEEQARGVITVSSGNHGRALAYVSKRLGIKAVVCLSGRVPDNKVAAIQNLGARVEVQGDSYEDAEINAHRFKEKHGYTMVEPFDDPFVIAGQGTIALEVLDDLSQVDTILVPLSGGGLMAGIALALKSSNHQIHVIGVSMDRGPGMYHSLKAGKPVDIQEKDTLADALVGNIGLENNYTFRMVQGYVDDIVLVSEEEIAKAMYFTLESHRLVVEGGGAVGVAALLNEKASHLGKNIVVVLSGGNVSLPTFLEIAEKGVKSSVG